MNMTHPVGSKPSMTSGLQLGEAYSSILSRCSVRQYSDRDVTRQQLGLLLEAAMAAPTAVNRQPWDFIAITDPDVRAEISAALQYDPMTKAAPAAICVCGNMDKALPGDAGNLWVQDCSAASENILLAAHALGLGAVWAAVYPFDERISEIRRILRLPEHVVPLNIITIGYPAHPPRVTEKYNPANIHTDRW